MLEDNVVGEHILLEEETEEDANEEEVEQVDIFEDEADENRNQPLTPAQTKLKSDVLVMEGALAKLLEAKLLGLESETSEKINKRIVDLKSEIKKKKQELKRKVNIQKAVKKYRNKKRTAEEALMKENPEVAKALKIRENVGRPRVEEDQPGLLEDILKIATIGAACGDRRRDDLFRTVKTLDDLKKAIGDLGYQVSRQALYLRLLPRDARTVQGKKHVKTVNVRLVKPQNDLRKKHPDRMFGKESCKAVDELVTFFGPAAAVFAGQDDKSSVPLGVPCAKKQSSMLMSMRVRVRLPDHDFKVGKRHLLTPSVLAVCNITQDGVTYTGPTYVAIRSSKHNGSTAFSHNEDLQTLVQAEKEIFMSPGSDSSFKPIFVKSVDGGPDENPRYFNNIVMGCKTFSEMDLDCYIEVTNAPGLSAYNRCERRMYHLSKEMTALVLPYETFGSHLNKGGETVDEDLEKKNFKAAGEILAEVWNNLVIDNYGVKAEFIEEPSKDETLNYTVTPYYRSRHILETRYMTIYLKCDDLACCSKPRTSVASFFPGRRIPALIPIHHTPTGPMPMELTPDINKKVISFPSLAMRIVLESTLTPQALLTKFPKGVPYDVYMPTQQDRVERQICQVCGKYHSSIKSLNIHKKICKKPKAKKAATKAREILIVSDTDSDSESDETSDEEIVEEVWYAKTNSTVTGGGIEKILDLADWMKLPWAPTVD